MAKLYFRYGAMGSSKTANALMVESDGNIIILKEFNNKEYNSVADFYYIDNF